MGKLNLKMTDDPDEGAERLKRSLAQLELEERVENIERLILAQRAHGTGQPTWADLQRLEAAWKAFVEGADRG